MLLEKIKTWYRHNILQIGGRINSDVRGVYWKCACGCGKEIVTPWDEVWPVIERDQRLMGELIRAGCSKEAAARVVSTQ